MSVVDHPTRPLLSLRLTADPASVPVARRSVCRAIRAVGVEDAVLERVQLAITEACANVVVHAYRDREPGELGIEVHLGPGVLCVRVRDQGAGVTPRLDSPGLGLGLPLIGALATSVDIRAGDSSGTEVAMSFARGDSATSEAGPQATSSATPLRRPFRLDRDDDGEAA
jgi:serine/threonine-protein kinase RsbW/stage II sporulation protein AB (anti-sigma F factor)